MIEEIMKRQEKGNCICLSGFHVFLPFLSKAKRENKSCALFIANCPKFKIMK